MPLSCSTAHGGSRHQKISLSGKKCGARRRRLRYESLELRRVLAFAMVVNNGPDDNRIAMVFLGDGYTANDVGDGSIYESHIDTALTHFFNEGEQPFERYEKYFNVHRIDVISNQTGADVPPEGIFRDTALDAKYFFDGVTDRLLYINDQKALNVLNTELAGAPFTADMQIVTINSTRYGGGGGRFATYAGGNSSATEVALHELGHSFSSLADEYGGIAQAYQGSEPSEVNVTKDPTGSKWDHWLGYNQPGIGVIGAYEGGRYHDAGIYRPSFESKMRALGRPFDAISREKIILDIYDIVDPLDGWLPEGDTVSGANPTLWVDTIDPDVIDVEWYVDGVLVPAATNETFNPVDFGFGPGTYNVSARAFDPTDWVRIHLDQLEQSIEWTVSIADSAPTVTLAASTIAIAESAGKATFTATLSAPTQLPVTVNLGFTGTATVTSDFTRSATAITIPAGQSTGSIVVTAVQDSLDEINETIIVDVVSVSGAIEAGSQRAKTAIVDDDAAPLVTLTRNRETIVEAGGVATITARLSAVSSVPVTVGIGISGTANGDNDYVASGNRIVIPAGQISSSLTFTAVQDLLDETNESVVVNITGVASGKELNDQRVVIYIMDDDAPPLVTFTRNAGTLAEAAGVATFTATLSAISGVPVTVGLGFSGTATLNTDFTASATRIIIAPGSTTGSIMITSIQDQLDETNETIIVGMTSIAGGTASGGLKASTAILDDDLAPSVTLTRNNFSILEAAGTTTFTAQLSSVSSVPVTIRLGFSGTASRDSDYAISSDRIVIPPGQRNGSITVTAIQDLLDETNESVIIDITSIAGGRELELQRATTFIMDDDNPPLVTLARSSETIAEANGKATFTATLSAASGVPVTIMLAYSGSASAGDYSASSDRIVIPAGQRTGSVTITAKQDLLGEPDESVVVEIARVIGGVEQGVQRAVVSIKDDDAAPLTVSNSITSSSVASPMSLLVGLQLESTGANGDLAATNRLDFTQAFPHLTDAVPASETSRTQSLEFWAIDALMLDPDFIGEKQTRNSASNDDDAS